jgi:hypothetical protein
MMKRILFCIVLAAAASASYAAEDAGLPDEALGIEYVRQESLELPGLTAGCHVCEWRPKLNQKPAPEQCGVDAAGDPLLGLFECGFSEDCERVCNFLGCGDET